MFWIILGAITLGMWFEKFLHDLIYERRFNKWAFSWVLIMIFDEWLNFHAYHG